MLSAISTVNLNEQTFRLLRQDAKTGWCMHFWLFVLRWSGCQTKRRPGAYKNPKVKKWTESPQITKYGTDLCYGKQHQLTSWQKCSVQRWRLKRANRTGKVEKSRNYKDGRKEGTRKIGSSQPVDQDQRPEGNFLKGKAALYFWSVKFRFFLPILQCLPDSAIWPSFGKRHYIFEAAKFLD